jgi:hypothetical protein
MMSRMKDWMMDMDECAIGAIEAGASNADAVVVHVKAHMSVCDESYIRRIFEEVMGPGDDQPTNP